MKKKLSKVTFGAGFFILETTVIQYPESILLEATWKFSDNIIN